MDNNFIKVKNSIININAVAGIYLEEATLRTSIQCSPLWLKIIFISGKEITELYSSAREAQDAFNRIMEKLNIEF